MASGEYLATKSQDEVFQGEMALEEEHFAHHRQREVEELEELLAELGSMAMRWRRRPPNSPRATSRCSR